MLLIVAALCLLRLQNLLLQLLLLLLPRSRMQLCLMQRWLLQLAVKLGTVLFLLAKVHALLHQVKARLEHRCIVRRFPVLCLKLRSLAVVCSSRC